MKLLGIAAVLSFVVSGPAMAMDFMLAGTDVRNPDARWIQAEGEIDENSVQYLIDFIETGPDWLPTRIRFNSPGGSLLAGLDLGYELRRRGFATEVGGHEPDPDWDDSPERKFTRRTPGVCASACAYAFMGGVERRIDSGSKIGVHQFYSSNDEGGGRPLVAEGSEQMITSLVLSYMLTMNVDARILVSAGFSKPEDMYWIGAGQEAVDTALAYNPMEWRDWTIQTLGEGIIASSERADSAHKMSALCLEDGGAFFEIYVSEKPEWDIRNWLTDQCLPAGSQSQGDEAFNILGNRVSTSQIGLADREGGFVIMFSLGKSPSVQGDVSFLYNDASMSACMTDDFIGTERNMQDAVSVAFKNCIQ